MTISTVIVTIITIFFDYANNDHATDNADHQDGPDFIYLSMMMIIFFTILQNKGWCKTTATVDADVQLLKNTRTHQEMR